MFRHVQGKKLGFYYQNVDDFNVVTIPLLEEMANYDYRYDALIISMFQDRSIIRYVDFFELLGK